MLTDICDTQDRIIAVVDGLAQLISCDTILVNGMLIEFGQAIHLIEIGDDISENTNQGTKEK